MFRKLTRRPKVPESLLDEAEGLTEVNRHDLKSILRQFLQDDPGFHDMYRVFLETRNKGLYGRGHSERQSVAHLRCLTGIPKDAAQGFLRATEPPNNVLHAIERLVEASTISAADGRRATFRYVLGCSQDLGNQYSHESSIVNMITAAERDRRITTKEATVAKHAFCLLLDPEEILDICTTKGIDENQAGEIYRFAEAEYRVNKKIAQMRHWKPIPRDEIQNIFDKGRGRTEQDARTEYLARQIMQKHQVDRVHAVEELNRSKGNLERASAACAEHAKLAQQSLTTQCPVPTRDTRSPPNVGPDTHVIAVLGIDERENSHNEASPSLGDGWIVSDFYLWLHILRGMGKSQQWITSMKPTYLVDKYGREDYVTRDWYREAGPGNQKPVQTKWASGFVHGDPFEDRKVVLDENLLPFVEQQITIGPHGEELRDYFLGCLKQTFEVAARSGDRVLILLFAHGDFDFKGGLLIGINDEEITDSGEPLLQPQHISPLLTAHPSVRTTIYMTSCFSGHWVETVEFAGRLETPVVLAAAKKSQDSFGFVWSHSQRHAGGLFSAATVAELLKEPSLPADVGGEAPRTYCEMTTALVAEMHRLCLPANVANRLGSSPVFSDPSSQELFWRRTGYQLHSYRQNWERLRTIPASDPHPKRNRKLFEGTFLDENDPKFKAQAEAWRQRHPGVLDEDYPEATGGYGGTTRGLFGRENLRYLIRQYLEAKTETAGREEAQTTSLIRQFYEGKMPLDLQLKLRALLIARLELHRKVNMYSRVLGLYRLPDIEQWRVGDTSKEYDDEKFNKFHELIARSGLLAVPSTPDGTYFAYYHKPSWYLAAGMLLAGYNELDVQDAIDRLWNMRRNNRFMDSVTRAYVKSSHHLRSVAKAREFSQTTWRRSRLPQSRPALSQVYWGS